MSGQHLLHRPTVDAGPLPRVLVAHALIHNSKPDISIQLHAVHSPPLVENHEG